MSGQTTTHKYPGRPHVVTRIAPELRALLLARAAEQGTDVSTVVRRALALHLAPEQPEAVLDRLST